MKLNKIALAVIAAAAAPVVANAGVTVTPLLLGYHYVDNSTDDKQREVLRTGKQLNNEQVAGGKKGLTNPKNGGVAKEDSLYTGAALGIELTPSTQFQVEYGVSEANAEAAEYSADFGGNRFDAKQEMITGNFLIGTEQFTGYTDSKFKPYVLIGAGQSKIKVENREQFVADASNGKVVAGQTVPAGTEVAETKDTIGNIGLGARYLVNDALALRGEVRGVHNFDNNWWEGLALAGLEVTLGGRLTPAVPVAPAPEPVAPTVLEDVVVDSDMDGVPDHLDACPGTPRNVVVDARGCPVTEMLQEDLRLELRVFFDRDKSAIKPQFREEVAKVAEKMREFPNATASIEGHASKDSNRSSAKYNQRLSEARANAVKSMLSNEFGIAPNRLSAVGYGFSRPIAPNDTAEGRAMNRRVFATITGNKTQQVTQTKAAQ
ncbi:hypothetical protein B0181_10285 [Moraxella caviae]|uniref:Outer membrane protein OmpAb n=1 Tax=Moraxella caviae TaxID=34060 RepID=A0A1S9ZVC6_9GAMM|nr:OmpA family protein [Moraxella caviae]OOR87482.1 hypothetical protein B0181_10285 [Moraxella caviae]STZ10618.1 Outer membrane protein OmpAb [Moraxella caviae]